MKDLMKPRIEVTRDYPGSPFKVGEVLELDQTTTTGGKTIPYKAFPPLHIEEDFTDKYPHLFRKMHWSKRRALSELPKYVQYGGKAVYECKWELDCPYCICWDANDEDRPLPMHDNCLPATLAEYEAYVNGKNK